MNNDRPPAYCVISSTMQESTNDDLITHLYYMYWYLSRLALMALIYHHILCMSSQKDDFILSYMLFILWLALTSGDAIVA